MNFERKNYERIWEHFNLITPFTQEEFDMVAGRAVQYKLKKGELVYKQGSIPAYGGLIFTGCMRHFHVNKNNRQETTVGFEFEDACFGDLRSIFYREPANTSLQALEETIIGRLDKAHYLYLFDHCKPFSKLMLLSMEHRFNELISHSITNRNEEAEDRYRKMLEAEPHILQRVPQRYIASYLGIKPQSLSRIRKNIMEQSQRLPVMMGVAA